MKTSEAYPSKYLSAEDLDGKDVTVTIAGVELVDLGQGSKKENKLCITMQGKKKGFIVNKTNAKTIEKLYGDETDEWIGQRIILSPREVEFQGDMVLSIRVSLKKPATAGTATAHSKAAPAEPEPAAEGDIASDDIPF